MSDATPLIPTPETPTFRVQVPRKWMYQKPRMLADIRKFYRNLFELLVDCRVIQTAIIHDPKRYNGCISLAHHTIGKARNVHHIKKSYIPGYVYWEKGGYCAWSETVTTPGLYEQSQSMTGSKAFVDNFIKNYTETKIEQRSTPFSAPKRPFIFLALQSPTDTVMQHAHIKTYDLIPQAAQWTKKRGYDLVVKFHPNRHEDARRNELRKRLSSGPHITVTDSNILKIIPKCAAVLTVNSGVGFEALLHRKPVITTGLSDYHWCTHVCETLDQSMEDFIQAPPQQKKIDKFLHWMMTKRFVAVDDKQQIKERLEKAVEEYEIH